MSTWVGNGWQDHPDDLARVHAFIDQKRIGLLARQLKAKVSASKRRRARGTLIPVELLDEFLTRIELE